jgi:hypothetical protein
MWRRENIVRNVSEIKVMDWDWMHTSQEREEWGGGGVVEVMMNLGFL